MGNIVNRVFDSSGPEGKVRGTPQQIIDKYTQLARDATLGNDRVAAENFQQHAEHYTRMLGEAQREQDARREQQEQSNRDRQRERNDGNNGNSGGDGGNNAGNQRREDFRSDAFQSIDQPDTSGPDVIEDASQGTPQPDLVMDVPPAKKSEATVVDAPAEGGEGNTLVETPEAKAKPKAKPRAPRTRKRKTDTPEASAAPAQDAPAEAPGGQESSTETAK
ncbi:protein of unknown function [Tropicimonas sediminicola]|uniref:DUF4167 domain-containing protein n=2 Tax=Tropicimonas sediminicola TaxID=1031541 RepID=A0A239EIK9_9RHOB|nr:protein of unknown function [Tropicimonas sediminicola]